MVKTQFSLAKMFQLTTITAIVVIFFAPVLRGLLSSHNSLLTLSFVHATFLAVLVARRTLGRDHTKYVGGKLLYRTPRYASSRINEIRVFDWLFLVSALAYLGFMSTLPATKDNVAGVIATFMHPVFFIPQYFFFDKAARTFVANVYGIDQHMVEVYEKGYTLNTFKFTSLEDLFEARLHRDKNKIELVYADAPLQGAAHKTIVVPAAHREEIVAALRKCTSRAKSVQPATSLQRSVA